MDTMSNMGLSKAASMRSMRRGSVQPPSSHHPSEGRKSLAHTASSRAALLQALNNNNNNTDFDRASETSSMEERRYAELLGPDPYADDGIGFGEVHEPSNVGHRLYICGVAQHRAREERLRAKRERIILRELNEMTTKPSITNHARLKPSKGAMFADHAEEWQRQRDERLRETAKRVEADRQRELMASPSINRRSAEIAESSGYLGPVEGWDDHFAKYYAKKSCAALQAPPPGMFTPNVNHLYRSRQSRGASTATGEEGINDSGTAAADVSTRLYEDAAAREEKQQRLREAAEEASGRDPFTNKPYFTPSRVEYNLGRDEQTPEEAGARLHALHEQKEARRLQKLAELDRAVEESKFRPALNPVSVEIGERRRRPLYEKKAFNASSATNNNVTNDSAALNASNASTTTAGGGPNTSKKISAARVEDFLRRTERNDSMRQQRLERIRSEAHERETGECTFKPAVNRKSMELFFEINQYGAELSEHRTNRHRNNNVSHASQHLAAASSRGPSVVGGGGGGGAVNGYGSVAGSTAVSTPRAGGGGGYGRAPSASASSHRAGGGGGGYTPSASPIYARSGGSSTPLNSYGAPRAGGGGGGYRDPMAAAAAEDRYGISASGGDNGDEHHAHEQDHANPNNGASAADFARQFEAQMFQVLDDWRRLEDV